MPILDTNNVQIASYNNFPNDANVFHLEIGAGRGCFGKKFFPNCYLTDIYKHPLPHFTSNIEYNEEEYEFLDHVIDFHEIESNKTFSKIICCNPIGFGFQGREQAKIFLDKISSLLSDEGELLVLGNNSNGWSNYRNAHKKLLWLQQKEAMFLNFQISPSIEIPENHMYRTNHSFYKMTVAEKTNVTQMYTIKKLN